MPEDFDFPIDPSSIALTPAEPRDSAKLLVFDRTTGVIEVDIYKNLAKYLPENTLLIFNDTKVVPARLPTHLPTGAKVELLWLKDTSHQTFEALSPRTLSIEEIVNFGEVTLKVLDKKESIYTFEIVGAREDFSQAVALLGTTPIPPYMKSTPLSEAALREKYQTTFARENGSVAAPTASLHFTPELFESIQKRGCEIGYVTLHVGLGTFAPLTEKELQSGTLHSEWYEIPSSTLLSIQKAREENRPIVAVGTTAARTLESCFASDTPKPTGITNLFIREGYSWKVVTNLITNFHVPKSSLMMLVATLIGREKLLELYSFALKNNFRFFSFGDGMYIK